MSARYNAQHPSNYPIAWLTAAQTAAAKPEEWVSVDWARGESGAVSRMKRLRAFRDGLLLNSAALSTELRQILQTHSLTFRKNLTRGVWDVQLCWKHSANSAKTILPQLLKDLP